VLCRCLSHSCKAAYHSLTRELAAADSSEDDDAIITAKDAKRMRKAVHHLAPTLLAPPPPSAAAAAPPTASPFGDGLSKGGRPVLLQQLVQGLPVQLPAAGFDSLGGLSEVKRQLKEMVLLPLVYPDLMNQLGIQAPRLARGRR
jgi:hypothetical protein